MQQTSYKCEYCNKDFKRENTLIVHMCVQKKRHMQETDKDVQLGYRAYQLFYRIGTNSKKDKSYTKFEKSSYYGAFIKFGKYCIEVKIDDVTGFTTWLLKNQVKLDHWTHDARFSGWVKERLKVESVDRAVERTILAMQDWAEDRESEWNTYFKTVAPSLAVFHICSGRISPWVIYASNDAQGLLDMLNNKQIEMIVDYIDPQYWQIRLKRKNEVKDLQWVETILKQASIG